MGSIAGSTFIKAYLDEYEHWTPSEQKKVWTFANIIPWNLSEKYPVFVVPRVEFYPVCWSNKTFWAGRPHSLKSSHAVHLWETLHPELSVEVLMKTCLASEIESMDADQSKSTGVVTLRTGLLSFD
jgi:hypothetical protein